MDDPVEQERQRARMDRFRNVKLERAREREQRYLEPDSGDYNFLATEFARYCTSFKAGNKLDGSNGALTVVQGNAWASLLTITQNSKTETVAAFQGTKAGDHTMIKYNEKVDPVFVYFGDTASIITEGHLEYVGALIECVYDQVSMAWEDTSRDPTYITGHSLGGA